jgi:hypothetical protein
MKCGVIILADASRESEPKLEPQLGMESEDGKRWQLALIVLAHLIFYPIVRTFNHLQDLFHSQKRILMR